MSNLIMTDLGTNLVTRSMGESKKLLFTKVLCGDGITSVDPRTLVNMIGTNTKPMTITGVTYEAVDESVDIECSINNEGVLTNFIISEFGIFAKLEGDASEVLFGYRNNKDTPEVFYAYGNGEQHLERTFKFSVGSFSNVGDDSNKSYSDKVSIETDYFKRIIGGLLGVAQHSLCNALPDNTGNWGWFDGGEIKKSDYPDLWLRVKPDVDNAVANVTSGVYEYLGSNNLKSYYGWYKGTTDAYFRKPNLMSNEVYLRPSTRNGGLYQVNNIQSHNHGASSAGAGSHNHTGTTDSAGNHTHNFESRWNQCAGGNNGIYASWPSAGFSVNNGLGYIDAAGAHTHTFTTTTVAAHSHTITVDNAGGIETTPKNVGCKVYGLLRF